MKIKIIATGESKWQRFIRRWGVSFLIGEDVLFDTFGDAGVLLGNMRKFNIDASKIKHIVLSHDDWDHISGLWYLIPKRKDITVYICPGFKQEIKERIVSFGVKVIEVKGLTQIKDDIYSTGELYGESDGERICEQSVVIKTSAGLTVICGCAHPGVVNIVRNVKEHFKDEVYALMGGFHLKDNSRHEINDIIIQMQSLNIKKIAPTHCTGQLATARFKQESGGGFIHVRQGSSIEV